MSMEFRFILYALAVFRLAEMLVIDNGPFDIFMEIRGWLNKGNGDRSLRRTIGLGFSCVYCAGTWLAFVFTFLFFLQNISVDCIVFFLALAGMQSILSRRAGRS